MAGGGIEHQTRQVLENVKAALALAGTTMGDVVKTTVWIEDARLLRHEQGLWRLLFQGAAGAHHGRIAADARHQGRDRGCRLPAAKIGRARSPHAHLHRTSLATDQLLAIDRPRPRSRAALYAAPGDHPRLPTLCSSPMVALRRQRQREGSRSSRGTAAGGARGILRQQAYEALRGDGLGRFAHGPCPSERSCWAFMAPWWRKAVTIAGRPAGTGAQHRRPPALWSPPSSTRTTTSRRSGWRRCWT